MTRLKRGQRVRIVDMRGCMADVRNNPREGVVIDFVNKIPYGSMSGVEYAKMQMTDGAVEERPSVARLWTEFDGLLEYRE